ncbi:MAG: hypothetical protein M3Z36_04080 [Acidobacteriota bacterium]|nr:hypothetical protein [Acidobacteriota bacterium]
MSLVLLIVPSWAQNESAQKAGGKAPQTSQESRISGKLIDAECHSNPKCRVGSSTKTFGLMLPDNTFLKFDEGGNAKVLEALKKDPKGRKLLNAKPGAAKRMKVSVSGTRTSDTYNLESIRF